MGSLAMTHLMLKKKKMFWYAKSAFRRWGGVPDEPLLRGV